jgi:hypothetical protein
MAFNRITFAGDTSVAQADHTDTYLGNYAVEFKEAVSFYCNEERWFYEQRPEYAGLDKDAELLSMYCICRCMGPRSGCIYKATFSK